MEDIIDYQRSAGTRSFTVEPRAQKEKKKKRVSSDEYHNTLKTKTQKIKRARKEKKNESKQLWSWSGFVISERTDLPSFLFRCGTAATFFFTIRS